MAEYLSPGVYVEEIDAGPKPIEGVSTSTAGAVGVTALGPTRGKPELVTSFGEFTRKFGGFLSEPDEPKIFNGWALDSKEGGRWWEFPLAVKGFFDNGGQRLYVKRVVSSTAKASSADCGQGLISEVVSDAAAGATQVALRHLIDVSAGDGLDVYHGDNLTAAAEKVKVKAYDPASGKVTLNAALTKEVSAQRGDFVVPTMLNGAAVNLKPAEPATPADATLRFKAKSQGKWGDAVTVRVRPMTGATMTILLSPDISLPSTVPIKIAADAPAGATNIGVSDLSDLENGDQIRFGTKTFAISNVTAGTAPEGTFDIDPPVPPGPGWKKDQTIARARKESASIAKVESAGTPAVFTLTLDDVRNLADGDHVFIDGREYVVSGKVAGDKTIKLKNLLGADAGEDWPVGTTVQRLRPANASGGDTINLRGAGTSLYKKAFVELDSGAKKEILTVSAISGDKVTLNGTMTTVYFEGAKARVIEAEVFVRYAPEGGDATTETFSNLILVDDGSLDYLVNQVNLRSAFVDVEAVKLSDSNLTKFPICGVSAAGQQLKNGDDKYGDLSPDDFVGTDGGSGKRTGIQSLEDIDEISICIAPGMWASTVHSSLIQHCEALKDRFAILDPQDGLSIEGIREFREPIDTKYAALYYPWIEVRDPSVRRNVVVAPSGHMAGIYARVDVERGVYKAPANEVIRGITKIAQDVTKREQDMLNPRNINVLRFFPGRGSRVWGARVVTSDAAWKYINVRRLFIYVEESIDEGTQWVVFEPNDEPLWARVRQTIANFLTSVWRSGALQGSKPDEAFFVKCDHTTMTQDDIDAGRLIVLVGIAPVKPAEFVIVRIQQKTLETKTN